MFLTYFMFEFGGHIRPILQVFDRSISCLCVCVSHHELYVCHSELRTHRQHQQHVTVNELHVLVIAYTQNEGHTHTHIEHRNEFIIELRTTTGVDVRREVLPSCCTYLSNYWLLIYINYVANTTHVPN